MYAAFDLGQRTIRAVLKKQDGKIINELKMKRQADNVLKFLTNLGRTAMAERTTSVTRLLYVDENHLIEEYDVLIYLSFVIHFAAA